MTFQKKLIGLILASLGLFACSVEDADDEIYWPTDTSGEVPVPKDSVGTDSTQDTTKTLEELELSYNYDLLYFYYINSSTELGKYEDYYGMGESVYPDIFLNDVYYMYDRMKDSYTIYYGPEYVEQVSYWLNYSEERFGIGAEVKMADSLLVVSQVYPKGPAAKGGLLKGDTVITIDGAKPTSISNFEKLTSGSKESSVIIEVTRGEGKTKEIEIILDSYITPTVFLDEVDSIPVIRITEYVDTTVSDSGTYGEFITALRATEGAKATIIDLRDNPGGSTIQCLNVASEALSKGDTIIIERSADADKNEENQIMDTIAWTAAVDGIGKGRYYVLLANNGSGSCSETHIAAMTSNLKTPLVGELTYGKGIGQYYFYTYMGIAKMTSMQVFDKNMESYHKTGIIPDFIIPTDDSETAKDSAMAKAVELAKEGTFKRSAGYGTVDQGHFPDKYLAKEASGKAGLEKGYFRIKKLK